MRTYSTFISLIFLVACANATKSVTYSDIVYSLIELNQEVNPNEGLEHLKKVNVSFAESKEKLEALDTRLRKSCTESQQYFQSKLQNQGNQLVSLEKSKAQNLLRQTEVAEAQEKERKIVAQNTEEINRLNGKIADEKAAFLENEKKRAEKFLVYSRLRNFIQDELIGSQRSTEMGAFNVDKSFSGKTSFVQFEHIKTDLAGIHAKTSDAFARTMITALISITQDKKFFVSKELVEKVQMLLNNLRRNEVHANEIEVQTLKTNKKSYKAIIKTIVEETERKSYEILGLASELSALQQNVKNFDSEILSFTKAQERQRRKITFHEQMCKKQDELINLHRKDFQSLEAQFQDLQNNLA